MRLWDSAKVAAVVLVMDKVKLVAFVERDGFRGVRIEPGEQNESRGPGGG